MDGQFGGDSGVWPEHVAELIKTPLGRRRLLQLVGAGAAALALQQTLPAFAADGKQPARHPQRHPRETGRDVRDVYLALNTAPRFERLFLRVGNRDITFTPLTTVEQALLAAQGTLFALMNRRKITHVARKVSLPRSGPVDLLVLGKRSGSNRVGIVAQRVHAPRWAAVAVAERGIGRAGSVAKYVRKAGWIKTLGLPPGAVNALTASDLAELDIVLEDTSTAMAFVYKHPEIMNLDAESSATTNNVLASLPEVQAFAAAIDQVSQTDYPYTFQNILNPDGSQAYVMDTSTGSPQPIVDPDTGQPTPAQQLVLNPVLLTPAGSAPFGTALKASISAIKDTPDLEDSTWEVTPTPAPQPQGVSTLLKGTPSLNVSLSRQGWKWGVQVQADAIDPSTRQIPLRIYNNWERSLAVHVQYFADKATQLAVDNHDQTDTDAAFRSTANSEYLTYVADMPTVYGIPWALDANYSSATITLPGGASSARLLVCGPGSQSDPSQWGQFFTLDRYNGKGYPTECQWPLISTWVFDIGVPSILMAADAAVADGSASSSLKSAIKYTLSATKIAVQNAMDGWQKLGGPLSAYFQNGNSQGASFQELALGLADLMPKVIWGIDSNFELYWKAGAVLTAIIIEAAIVKMIPIMGEVFAAVAALGDLAQIATTSAEMLASPWVIDTDIRITYPATLTVQKDPKDATWPRAAGGASWSLSILSDGTSTNDPITGTIPDGQSADIVVDLPAVAISKTVQYTFSVTDANGNLIGKGSTDVLPNNNLQALPVANTIQIQEIMKPLTAQTTFVRQDTLVYNTTAGGYSWASNVKVPTTITSKPGDLLELDSITVGTVSGMVGSIWRSNDTNKNYWVRNSPDVQNGSTVKLQFAGPYTRKPLIVYDRLNPDPVNGNNFFLEPVGDVGYLVRKLQLSASGGTLGWTPNQAWGQFQHNLADVTIHPNNFLVGVDSVNGKIHKLPILSSPTADNNYPILSQAFAGPASAGSTRPGLTQTPIGVAITLTGVVVVLEAGANRLQAFDVDGNPVAYFGTPPNTTYFAPLANNPQDTLLSLGVDGVGWFYVLAYSGSGTNAGDYHVNIHKPDGTFMFTEQGINAAALDVDYWRNLFSLDYAAVLTSAGGNYVEPAIGRIEPSASIWVPSNPPSAVRS